MSLWDSLRRLLRPGSAMRDRHGDREAGSDPKFDVTTPSGTVGPSGATIESALGEGGAIEPDPPTGDD